jgi:hypothetical protein
LEASYTALIEWALDIGAKDIGRFAERLRASEFCNATIDGTKLTIQFDRAGEKRVVDSLLERV